MSQLALLHPVLVAAATAVVATTAHHRLPPRIAVRFVTLALVSIVVAAVPTLVLVAVAFLAHVPLLGLGFQWCAEAIGIHAAVPAWLGLPAVVLLAVGAVRSIGVLREHRRLRHDEPGPVMCTGDRRAFAVTLPGRGGQIVLSQGLVDLLEPHETRVVLAHERAHAHHRHDRYLLLAELAAAMVPPLGSLAARVRYSLERWADEAAVRSCGDRRLVAETLAKVALHGSSPLSRVAGFAGLGVGDRVRALLAPPAAHPTRPAVLALWASLAATAAFSAYQLHHLEALVAALCPH